MTITGIALLLLAVAVSGIAIAGASRQSGINKRAEGEEDAAKRIAQQAGSRPTDADIVDRVRKGGW